MTDDLEALIEATQGPVPGVGEPSGSGAPSEPAEPREPVPATLTHPLGGAFLGDPASLRDMRPSAVRQSPGQAVRRRHDLECEAFALAGLQVAAASLRGLSHAWDGRPNQDAFFVGLSEDERWIIAVVADGVSSAVLADLAAETAARECWRAVRSGVAAAGDPGAVDWAGVGSEIQSRVLAQGRRLVGALALGADADELSPEVVAEHFASTAEVLLVEVDDDPAGVRRVARLGVSGDSTCALLDQTDPDEPRWSLWAAGKDLDSDVTTNAVSPLPLPQPELVAAWAQLRPRQVLALMTDGMGDPLADGATLTGRHLADRWRHPLSAVKFLDSCAFVVAGGEDDRTAVAVWA